MNSEERRLQNKMHIIDVAGELFAQYGVQATTIAQIAGAAGVVSRTVLYIFGTKENLVFSVMERNVELTNENMKRLIDRPDYQKQSGLEQVMQILKERAEYFFNTPQIVVLLSGVDILTRSDKIDELLIRQYFEKLNHLSRFVDRALERGISDGSIRSNLNRKEANICLLYSFRATLLRLVQIRCNDKMHKCMDTEVVLTQEFNVIRYYLTH